MPTMFITKDTSLRIRADAVGLIAQDYDAQRVEISELYTGHTELFVSREAVDQMYRPSAEVSVSGMEALAPNEFVLLKDAQNPVAHRDGADERGEGESWSPCCARPRKACGASGRGTWSRATRSTLLLNDEIKLVTIVGKAGTGKTLLAIASGLHKTTEEGNYQKLLVSRPIFPLGRDIGYLPGRRGAEAESLDAAHLRQRGVPDEPQPRRQEGRAAATTS
jgi:PhoH-like ATPase